MRPSDFAAQLNVSLNNGWGIVRTIVDLCLKHPEGKYVLIKDPNKVYNLLEISVLLTHPCVAGRPSLRRTARCVC